MEGWREREARAWRDLRRADYDRAIGELLAEAAGPAAVVAVASATLRRDDPALVDSRAAAAERLLALAADAPGSEPPGRVLLLVLLAWLRLAEVVARGPDRVAVAPDLPPGVTLPAGASSDSIGDPALRDEARSLARAHAAEAERWNARQHAIGAMREVARSVGRRAASSADDARSGDAWRELRAAMALAPALPDELRLALRAATEDPA